MSYSCIQKCKRQMLVKLPFDVYIFKYRLLSPLKIADSIKDSISIQNMTLRASIFSWEIILYAISKLFSKS